MPVAVARCEPIVFKVAFTILLIIVFWANLGSIDALREGMFALGIQLACLTILLLSLGFALGRIFRLPFKQRIVLAAPNEGKKIDRVRESWKPPSRFAAVPGDKTAVAGENAQAWRIARRRSP